MARPWSEVPVGMGDAQHEPETLSDGSERWELPLDLIWSRELQPGLLLLAPVGRFTDLCSCPAKTYSTGPFLISGVVGEVQLFEVETVARMYARLTI